MRTSVITCPQHESCVATITLADIADSDPRPILTPDWAQKYVKSFQKTLWLKQIEHTDVRQGSPESEFDRAVAVELSDFPRVRDALESGAFASAQAVEWQRDTFEAIVALRKMLEDKFVYRRHWWQFWRSRGAS